MMKLFLTFLLFKLFNVKVDEKNTSIEKYDANFITSTNV